MLVADDAGAGRSAHLTARFTHVRLTKSQSAIAAAALQLAVELPFPTLLFPSSTPKSVPLASVKPFSLSSLAAGFTRVRLTESQSAIAAAVLQLAVELPFPTLLLPS